MMTFEDNQKSLYKMLTNQQQQINLLSKMLQVITPHIKRMVVNARAYSDGIVNTINRTQPKRSMVKGIKSAKESEEDRIRREWEAKQNDLIELDKTELDIGLTKLEQYQNQNHSPPIFLSPEQIETSYLRGYLGNNHRNLGTALNAVRLRRQQGGNQ